MFILLGSSYVEREKESLKEKVDTRTGRQYRKVILNLFFEDYSILHNTRWRK